MRQLLQKLVDTNIGALQVFHLLRQGTTILLAILLAKSSLGVSGIGNYEWLVFIGYTFSFFWITGLTQGLLSFFPKKSAEEQAVLIGQAYMTFMLISSAIWAVLMLGKGMVCELLTNGQEPRHYGLYVTFLLINLPTYLLEFYFQLRNRSQRIVAFGALAFVGQLLAVSLPVYLGYGLRGSFLALIVLAGIKHLWLLAYVLRYGSWGRSTKNLQRWLVISLPLIGYALLGGLHQTFDNWLVNFAFHGDEQQFAYWRYGARELPLAMAMVTAFSTALLPELSSDLEAAMKNLRHKSRWLFHMLFPLSALLLLSAGLWWPLVFSEELMDGLPVFQLFVLILISRLIFSRTVLMGLLANREILIVSVIELLLNVLLSFLLVPHLGLAGIALGTVLAYSFEKIALAAWLRYRYHVNPGQYTDLGLWGGYSLLLLGAYGLSVYLYA